MRMIDLLEPVALAKHIAALTQELHERLVDDGYPLWSPSDPALRGPQVALRDDDPDSLAKFLAERRIVTSPRGQLLRLSVHYYNTSDDIDSLLVGLRAYRSR
jgi:selenocysteine lyase/cysteine desulfurase